MNQLEAFIVNLEKSLERRYQQCNDAATPSSIMLAVLNAVADARSHLNDQCSSSEADQPVTTHEKQA